MIKVINCNLSDPRNKNVKYEYTDRTTNGGTIPPDTERQVALGSNGEILLQALLQIDETMKPIKSNISFFDLSHQIELEYDRTTYEWKITAPLIPSFNVEITVKI